MPVKESADFNHLILRAVVPPRPVGLPAGPGGNHKWEFSNLYGQLKHCTISNRAIYSQRPALWMYFSNILYGSTPPTPYEPAGLLEESHKQRFSQTRYDDVTCTYMLLHGVRAVYSLYYYYNYHYYYNIIIIHLCDATAL